ncbi:hypothetical protein Trydic_g18888 [Trypoxylus dichotomus]
MSKVKADPTNGFVGFGQVCKARLSHRNGYRDVCQKIKDRHNENNISKSENEETVARERVDEYHTLLPELFTMIEHNDRDRDGK